MITKTPPTPLRGEKLLKTAVNQILAHPNTWDQTHWHSSCGSKHCIAGWCQILAGHVADEGCVTSQAQEALGISMADRAWLFAPIRTLAEIYRFAETFSAGFDRDGFDRDGFDRAGRDRAGKPLTPFEI